MTNDVWTIGGVVAIKGPGRRKGSKHTYAEHAADGTITVVACGHVYCCTADRRVAAQYLAKARKADAAWRWSQRSWLRARRRPEESP